MFDQALDVLVACELGDGDEGDPGAPHVHDCTRPKGVQVKLRNKV